MSRGILFSNVLCMPYRTDYDFGFVQLASWQGTGRGVASRQVVQEERIEELQVRKSGGRWSTISTQSRPRDVHQLPSATGLPSSDVHVLHHAYAPPLLSLSLLVCIVRPWWAMMMSMI